MQPAGPDVQREVPTCLKYELMRETQSSPVFIFTIAPEGCVSPALGAQRPDPACQLELRLEGIRIKIHYFQSQNIFKTDSKYIVSVFLFLSSSTPLHFPSHHLLLLLPPTSLSPHSAFPAKAGALPVEQWLCPRSTKGFAAARPGTHWL